MNCTKANKKISALIDGRLVEKDRLALFEHIKVCPDCKKLYDKTKAITEQLRLLPEVPLPEGAENRVHFALEREAQKPRKKNWIKFAAIALPATAAVFAAALGISYLFSGGLTKSTNEMTAMDMAPAEEAGVMQKSMIAENVDGTLDYEEPQMTSEPQVAGEAATRMMEADEEESLAAPVPAPDLLLNVVFTGESPEEMRIFVEDMLGSFADDMQQAAVLDGEMQSIKIVLPIGRYEEFTDVVENSENLTFAEETQWDVGAYGEGLLFEVNFLFQKNN